MSNPLAALASLKPPARLRAAGIAVLVLGVLGAALFYGIAARSAPPSIDDSLPGYSRAEARQIGILMGNFGVTMVDWAKALEEPSTQAIIIAIVSALAARVCFRAAEVMEDNERFRLGADHHDG